MYFELVMTIITSTKFMSIVKFNSSYCVLVSNESTLFKVKEVTKTF